jgi:hypothetical protein
MWLITCRLDVVIGHSVRLGRDVVPGLPEFGRISEFLAVKISNRVERLLGFDDVGPEFFVGIFSELHAHIVRRLR